MNQIKLSKNLYENIDSLFESWEMRISIALLANKAISRDKAINPQILPTRYENSITDPIEAGYVKSFNGLVYLTTRGLLIANRGMMKMADNNMWPPIME